MKFRCDKCQAKYQVPDEKVAGKTLRMSCRRCGHLIEVRPGTPATPTGQAGSVSTQTTQETGASPALGPSPNHSPEAAAPPLPKPPSLPPPLLSAAEVNPSVISARSARQTGQFRSFPDLNALSPQAAPAPSAAAALAQHPPPPSVPGARKPVSILPPPMPGPEDAAAAPNALYPAAPFPPDDLANEGPADSDGQRPARVPSIRPGMLAYPAMPIHPSETAAKAASDAKPETHFEVLQTESKKKEEQEEDDSVITRRASEIADIVANPPSASPPQAPREALPSAPDNQPPIPLERRISSPPAAPGDQRPSGPPPLPQRISANPPPPIPQRISNNGPPSGRISANPPPPPIPQRISNNGPPSGRISANPPPPPIPQRISNNGPPSGRISANPPPPSGRAHLPPLGAPPPLTAPSPAAPPPLPPKPPQQRASAPPPLPNRPPPPKPIPPAPPAAAEPAGTFFPPSTEAIPPAGDSDAKSIPAAPTSTRDLSHVPRARRRRSLHPLAYAFIAMSAVFGGVAAFAFLYPPDVPANPIPPSSAANAQSAQPGSEHVSGNMPDNTSSTPSPVPSSSDEPVPAPSAAESGALPDKEVERVFAEGEPLLRRKCWQPASDAKVGGGPSARMNASVVVGENGRVESVTVGGSELAYPGLSTCIANRIRRWKFPKAQEKTQISKLLVFSAQ